MKRKIINGIYGAASAAVAVLLGMVILGQEAFVRYETVITVSLADRAYFILMAAAVPMALLAVAVCNCNDIRNSRHPKRNQFLLFIPALICFGSIVLLVGTVLSGMVNSILNSGRAMSQS